MTAAISVVVGPHPTGSAALADTMLSLAAQPTSPVAIVVRATPDTRDAVARTVDEFRPLLPPTSVRTDVGDVDRTDLGGATHVTELRAGDVLFDHFIVSALDAIDGDTTRAVRMRFVRQRTSLTPTGAPRAESIPVRPYADAFDAATHAHHSPTPSSAVVLPLDLLADVPITGDRDRGRRALVEADRRGVLVDAPEITSLVRAWSDDEWALFERGVMEAGPGPDVTVSPSAAQVPRSLAARLIGRLRGRTG